MHVLFPFDGILGGRVVCGGEAQEHAKINVSI